MGNRGLLVKLTLAGISGCFLVAVIITPRLRAQSQSSPDQQSAAAAKMSFDVASIKPSQATSPFPNYQITPARFAATGATAVDLIGLAYKIKNFQIERSPDWAKASKFDVDATIGDAEAAELQALPATERSDRSRSMLQSMLADRFKLEITRQTKVGPIYALVIAKGGPKLPEPPPTLSPEDKGLRWQRLNLDQFTMISLANFLSSQPEVNRVVVDQTGLTGKYDLKLQWSSDTSGATGAPGMTIFEAIDEQLGLKLESQTGPVDTIVIDHIEQPSPN